MNVKTKLEHIQQLEVGTQQLAMLALVILGKKPAIELALYKWNTDPRAVITLLESLGMTAYDAGPKRDGNTKHVASICISNNPSDALLLLHLVRIRETSRRLSPSFHVAYGALMGFPLSAIEAFINESTLYHDEDPVGDTEQLQVFKFSKDSWKKEVEVIFSWRRGLQQHAPEILKKLDSMIVKREKIES